MNYTTGDWITYRTSQGWTTTAVIIDTAHGKLTVGNHPNDPDTKTISKSTVVDRIDNKPGSTRYSEGDDIVYNHPQGWSTEATVLTVRPDNKLVVGSNPHDDNASTINTSDVIEKVKPT